MTDTYQERYLAHQARKQHVLEMGTEARSFWDVLACRHSQRIFDERLIGADELERLYEAIRLAPSSCNRQAIVMQPVFTEALSVLEALLVGGRGWMGKASVGLLLFADMRAYKSPSEVGFMPYLDAGFVAQNVYLAAEALGIGACFVNPNIREENRATFEERFNPAGLRFCGAMALGRYDLRTPEAPKRAATDIFYPSEVR